MFIGPDLGSTSTPKAQRSRGFKYFLSLILSFALATSPPISAQQQAPPQTPAAPTSTARPTAAAPNANALRLEPLRLVRCYHNAELGCFRVLSNVASPGAEDSLNFQARLDSADLVGPGEIRSVFDLGGPINLLVVYDISGSMKGDGMAFTRLAVRDFINDLPANVSTAVVPFEARGVAAAFERARFGNSRDAVEQLERIPEPTNGNTALYSAIDNALLTLDKLSAAGARSILLVITDGVNDVRGRGDDPGLLAGDAGLETVRDHVAKTPHNVWLVGAGIVDSGTAKMRVIAGSTAKAKFTEMDPGKLRELLRQIRLEMTPTRLMVYAIPAVPRADLGRRRRQFQLEALQTPRLTWRPPLVALPPFEGDADSTLLLLPRMREMANDVSSSLNQRLLIGLPLLILLVFAHWMLPRVIGAPERDVAPATATPGTGASATGPPPKAAAKKDAVRLRSVAEAPPRTPGDITKDAAT